MQRVAALVWAVLPTLWVSPPRAALQGDPGGLPCRGGPHRHQGLAGALPWGRHQQGARGRRVRQGCAGSDAQLPAGRLAVAGWVLSPAGQRVRLRLVQRGRPGSFAIPTGADSSSARLPVSTRGPMAAHQRCRQPNVWAVQLQGPARDPGAAGRAPLRPLLRLARGRGAGGGASGEGSCWQAGLSLLAHHSRLLPGCAWPEPCLGSQPPGMAHVRPRGCSPCCMGVASSSAPPAAAPPAPLLAVWCSRCTHCRPGCSQSEEEKRERLACQSRMQKLAEGIEPVPAAPSGCVSGRLVETMLIVHLPFCQGALPALRAVTRACLSASPPSSHFAPL